MATAMMAGMATATTRDAEGLEAAAWAARAAAAAAAVLRLGPVNRLPPVHQAKPK